MSRQLWGIGTGADGLIQINSGLSAGFTQFIAMIGNIEHDARKTQKVRLHPLAVNGIPVSDHGPYCARNDF
jgi:hypothetical protein